MQLITVLGSTGSIGGSALDVIAQHPDQFAVFALVADSSEEVMLQQIQRYQPRFAVLCDVASANRLRQKVQELNSTTEVLAGEQAILDVTVDSEVHTVVAAIVGAAGLQSTMAAVRYGKKVLLANKESLVMAGGLLMQAVDDHKALLLPVDSEHNAIFQCLPSDYSNLEDAGIERLLLTGSGGPFRELPLSQLTEVTPAQACAHPNWEMGQKISVDSATMMNKGLEYIEACWLFAARPDQIEVVVHPQSIVHSMVEYIDGSVLAQLGQPDMRTPIAHCLGWPHRIASQVPSLNWAELGRLDFCAPDLARFPCLALAMQAMKHGGTAPTALNAVNEVAVAEFLAGRISFNNIAVLVQEVMDSWSSTEPDGVDAVIHADREARELAVRRSKYLLSASVSLPN